MKEFIAKHGHDVSCVLNGWDRILFRGLYRLLTTAAGVTWYMHRLQVRLVDFGDFFEGVTKRLVQASAALADQAGRPNRYLASTAVSKEEVAQQMLAEAPISEGLIGVVRGVEPCWTYEMRSSGPGKRELVASWRKCQFLYHYYLDPHFGFMHVRIQSWLPFGVQVYVNGREWLARRMDELGLKYHRADNCFTWIEDPERAQALMDELVSLPWAERLNALARRVNPGLVPNSDESLSYYWTGYQTEWATDLAFKSPQHLGSVFPQLALGAITCFSSRQVLRFLQRRATAGFTGEVTSDYAQRVEGLRVKHMVNGNSLKMYDKQVSVLRIETTISNPRDLTVYRTSERKPRGEKSLRRMRQGIADLTARAQKSQRTNEHYLDALGQLDSTEKLHQIFAGVSRPVKRRGKRARALRVWTREDQTLLTAIARPEFLMAGFRNRDLAHFLYPDAHSSKTARRAAAARVSYRLSILRQHGLIQKLANTRRYRITAKGRQICMAATLSQNVTMQALIKAAA